MKVTYQTCCGVDIHKSFLVTTMEKAQMILKILNRLGICSVLGLSKIVIFPARKSIS